MNKLHPLNKIIIATSNQGKRAEFEALLAPLHIQVVSNLELDLELIPDVEEDGNTFEENALKKAQAYFDQFGIPALADDSGLEIEALEGRPGIYSARYAGPGCTDADNIMKVLKELKDVPFEQRRAQFTCVIAFVDGQNDPTIVKGHCTGYIAEKPSGTEGFGYDPIFYLPERDQTLAQISMADKNAISHRYHAMQALVEKLKNRI